MDFKQFRKTFIREMTDADISHPENYVKPEEFFRRYDEITQKFVNIFKRIVTEGVKLLHEDRPLFDIYHKSKIVCMTRMMIYRNKLNSMKWLRYLVIYLLGYYNKDIEFVLQDRFFKL